ncbi:hypothetical protein F511_32996 [Dorcoceras hygrometricum]|uniref:Uncharacterized protein n=1 Tax=Dorcoceras hygrometricum TaxID=472368 RepID=A0A2Z7BTQ7_9LAMI|nr:hypothetical protein F511_32996 [Dorcoceras hygrometricum]
MSVEISVEELSVEVVYAKEEKSLKLLSTDTVRRVTVDEAVEDETVAVEVLLRMFRLKLLSIEGRN